MASAGSSSDVTKMGSKRKGSLEGWISKDKKKKNKEKDKDKDEEVGENGGKKKVRKERILIVEESESVSFLLLCFPSLRSSLLHSFLFLILFFIFTLHYKFGVSIGGRIVKQHGSS